MATTEQELVDKLQSAIDTAHGAGYRVVAVKGMIALYRGYQMEDEFMNNAPEGTYRNQAVATFRPSNYDYD